MSFVTDFDPERGDVIYGISPARTAYKNAWLDAQMAHITKLTPPDDPHFKQVAALGWHQMDEYNNYYCVPTISGARTSAQADVHLAAKSADATNNADAAKNLDRVRQYKDVLSGSRFSPSNVFNAPAPKLAAEGYNATHYTDSRNWLQKMVGAAKAKSNACARRWNRTSTTSRSGARASSASASWPPATSSRPRWSTSSSTGWT